jgi:hypothetical protein
LPGTATSATSAGSGRARGTRELRSSQRINGWKQPGVEDVPAEATPPGFLIWAARLQLRLNRRSSASSPSHIRELPDGDAIAAGHSRALNAARCGPCEESFA